jgi:hypothetical protein
MPLFLRVTLVVATLLAGATASAAAITGTVTNAANGARLANMVVAAYDATGIQRGLATTGSDGRYSISVPSGDYRVLAWDNSLEFATAFDGGAESFETSPVRTLTASSSVEVNFALVVGGTIRGSVTNSSGNPVGVAVVEIYNLSGTRRTFAAVDSAGHFSIVVPPGDYKAVAYDPRGILATQFHQRVRAFSDAAVIHVDARDTVSGVSFRLAQTASIDGTVVDGATGVALPGVVVYAYTAAGAQVTSASTDASGAYRLLVPSGDYRLVAGDPERVYATTFHVSSRSFEQSDVVVLSDGQQLRDVRLTMQRGGSIEGHIPAGAGITVQAYNADGTLHVATITDTNGNYRLVAAPGEYRIVAFDAAGNFSAEFYGSAQTFAAATPVLVTAGSIATGVNIDLDRAGRVSGRAVRGTTAQPLAKITIAAYDADNLLVATTRTGSDGRYVLALRPGVYRLAAFDEELNLSTAYAGGARTFESSVPVTIVADTAATVDFTLAAGVRVSGLITNAQGEPLSGVDVFALDAAGERVAGAVTHGDGSYVMAVPPGSYKFVAIDGRRRFGSRYYPGVQSFGEALPVSIAPGQSPPVSFELVGLSRRRAVRH